MLDSPRYVGTLKSAITLPWLQSTGRVGTCPAYAACFIEPVPMNEQRRTEIEIRWLEIDRELAEIAECKTTKLCAPPAREADLLMEQDSLEFELGQADFDERP